MSLATPPTFHCTFLQAPNRPRFKTHIPTATAKAVPAHTGIGFAAPEESKSFMINVDYLQANSEPSNLIQVLREQKNAHRALKILRWVSQQHWYVPNHNVYEFMLKRFGSARRFDEMREVALMAFSILRPSEKLFFAMLHSYVQANLPEQAHSVLKEMQVWLSADYTFSLFFRTICSVSLIFFHF
eukprot:TRINITY_DN15609_c0_g1_i3.p1 TRINITY_DN15609_c0_g1~~TRINITY_DN15609_c0_g1_i3.p1  ORF type:complete len:185 (+),score=10.73 TRINITY_DN15609_c0_g1_i3:134-688(+)